MAAEEKPKQPPSGAGPGAQPPAGSSAHPPAGTSTTGPSAGTEGPKDDVAVTGKLTGVPAKLCVLSTTGQTRPCGTYMVPHDHPLILDLSKVDPRDLGELEADPRILVVRTDSPITPASDITRFKRA